METAVFIVATVAFIVGAIGIAYEGAGRTPSQRARTGIYAFAAVAAALAYAVMANGGGLVSSRGGMIWAPRFLLWIVAAPALLVALALVAFPVRRRNIGLTVALGIATAAAFAALGISALTAGLTHWVWFTVSVALLLGAFGIVWLSLREYAQEGHPDRRDVFIALAGATTVLWAIIPVTFFFGPNGVGLWGAEASTVLYALADVGLMVGTGLLAVWSGRHLIAVEAAERGETAMVAVPSPFRRPERRPASADERSSRSRDDRPTSAPEARPRATAPDEPSGDARRDAAARIRDEWAGARERLLARGRRSGGRPTIARTRTTVSAGRTRPRPLGGLGGPPERLVLRRRIYHLVGPVARGDAAAAVGRPVGRDAEPPREVSLGGYRYRRSEDDRSTHSAPDPTRRPAEPPAAPQKAGASPRFRWRSNAPGASARPAAEPARPVRPPRKRPNPASRPTVRGFVADLPLHRIPPESAVPVAIVVGVLYWVSRPRKDTDLA